VANHLKTMLPTFYDFDILFEDTVVYAGLEMHRANRSCWQELCVISHGILLDEYSLLDARGLSTCQLFVKKLTGKAVTLDADQ
jgi:hypothetical protein